MQEKVIEIIVYLVTEMRMRKELGEIDISTLSERGYTQTEISTAFSWLVDKMQLGDALITQAEPTSPHSRRFFHHAERSAISLEGQGYLLQLRELGLVNDMDFEQVMDRIMLAGFGEVSIDHVKMLIASVMFSYEDRESGGMRMMLTASDTIH